AHPSCALMWHNLGVTAVRRPAEAVKHYRQALALYEKLYDGADTWTRPSRTALARALALLGLDRETAADWAAARKARQESLQLFVQLQGDKHWLTADARRALAHLDVLAKLTAAQRQRLAEADKLQARVRALDREKKHKEALALAIQVGDIRREILGELDASSLASRDWVGWLHQASGDLAAAEAERLRHLEISRKLFGEQHPEYAFSSYELGLVFKARKKHAKAAATFDRAWQIRQQLLG